MKKSKLLPFLSIIYILATLNSSAQAPNWLWAKSADGNCEANSVTIDANGNTYVAGWFSNTLTFGSTTLYDTSNNQESDMFVVKYNASGNPLWAKSAGGTKLGGTIDNVPNSIAVDANGNIYVAGSFTGTSITFGSSTLTNAGGYSAIFIVKYDTLGNTLWAKSAGGSGTGDDYAYSVSVDKNGNAYVVGTFESPTITFGSTTLTQAGIRDIFIVKYDTSGNPLWAKSAGGNDSDEAFSVTVDANGNSYMAGYYGSTSITFGSTTFTNSNNIHGLASTDIFIVKYDSSGNPLWAKNDGVIGNATGENYAKSIAIDVNGNTYVAGFFTSHTITFGSTTLTNTGGYDMFIVKYDSSGNSLWAKSVGNASYVEANSVAVDKNGNTSIVGWFNNPTMTIGSTTLTNTGNRNMFIVEYDASGNPLWAKSAGGTSTYGVANSVTVDANGNAYVVGFFQSSPISFGTNTLTISSAYDMFIAKLCGSSCTTDIMEHNMETDFYIYPNPTNGLLNLQMSQVENAQIKIYNVFGECIYQNISTSSNQLIDLSSQADGIYFINIKTNEGMINKKIIVNH